MVVRVVYAATANEFGKIVVKSCLTDKIAVVVDTGVNIGVIYLGLSGFDIEVEWRVTNTSKQSFYRACSLLNFVERLIYLCKLLSSNNYVTILSFYISKLYNLRCTARVWVDILRRKIFFWTVP